MSDELPRKIDHAPLKDNCCGCDESKNPSSGVCPAPLEHMTNWRTEHTRVRLPEDNFAYSVETQKINPNDCNCDPIVESCCYNLNDIPDKIYADFYVDNTLGNVYPCLRPQEGRVGALHSYETQYVQAQAGANDCRTFRKFGRAGIVPWDIFCPVLKHQLIQFPTDNPFLATFDQPLKKILEAVGGSLAEDKRYVDKFTVELKRNRTFDSHSLPQNISAVRHIYDVKEQLNAEAYHYRNYYYRENCAPTGVVWSRQPPLDLVKDIPPCEYTQLKTIDCVPKMVWEGDCFTPGGRPIKVLYFCDGVDPATNVNTFKTMIFHLDTIKNEWGTFKERDFWNIFEKFEPHYDVGDWWSWHEDRDWARFLLYDIWPDEYYLDPNQDYRVIQNYNYLSTVGYNEWVVKDDEVWTYYKNLSVSCKNYYAEYCSKRGFYVPEQESVQLDAPFQATTVRQMAPFFELDTNYPYDEDMSSTFNDWKPPCSLKIAGTCEYDMVLNEDWDEKYFDAHPEYLPENLLPPYVDNEGFAHWHYDAVIKRKKGPFKYLLKHLSYMTQNPNPTSLDDYYTEAPQYWTLGTKRENVYAWFYSANRKARYPLNKRLPNKAPLLLKLFGRWNCPYTVPKRFRDLSLCGKLSFPLYISNNGVKETTKANAEVVAYKPYYSPPFYKVDIRYTLKDKPVEEHPSTAKVYCPKLPESFLETQVVPDESSPWGYRTEFVKQLYDFPNGIYPKHLFVTVEKTLLKSKGRNNLRLSYDADMSSGSPKWNTAHPPLVSPIIKEYLDNVGPPPGEPWFEPKKISSTYTDLFYRIGFVGALGTPENLTLCYGEWRDPETFKKEYDREFYNTPQHLQYLSTTTFYDDLKATLRVTSTDPNEPEGTITLSSFQESFTGSPYHRFTNQDLECPYIEFPLVTYKLCKDFGGIYGTDDCVYFPYISPIGEESKIDSDAESPMQINSDPRRKTKFVCSTHTADWSGGLAATKNGYNDPHLGAYIKGKFLSTSGIIGGNNIYLRDGAFAPEGRAYPFAREELGIFGPFRRSITNGFDCDEQDLQAVFLESEVPYPISGPSWTMLSPIPGVRSSPATTIVDNGLYFYQMLYAARGQRYPRRSLHYYSPGTTCDALSTQGGYLAFFDGMTDEKNNDESTMNNIDLQYDLETPFNFEKDPYDNFVLNTVEAPWQLVVFYDGVTYQNTFHRVKPPNQTVCTDAWKSAENFQDQIRVILNARRDILKTGDYCSPDYEGSMPLVNLLEKYEYYNGTETITLTYDDLSGHPQVGGDGLPHYYNVNFIQVNRTSRTVVSNVRLLSEIQIPRYQYPHGFYFKCIVTA